MPGPRAKPLLVALVLAAVLAGVGVAAIRSSAYLDVSEVVKLDYRARVTVQGRLADLSYDPSTNTIYLVLEGKDGSRLLAVVDADYVTRKYGPLQYIKWSRDRVVVQGVYDPETRTLTVYEILEGCHSSYEQPAVTG